LLPSDTKHTNRHLTEMLHAELCDTKYIEMQYENTSMQVAGSVDS